MSYKVEPVIKQVCSSIGEGPHWDEASQTLLYVDIMTGDVHRWNSVTKEDTKLHVADEFVSLIVPCEKGGFVVSTTRSLAHLDWESNQMTVWAEVEQDMPTRFNDGKCDTQGRLWAGTMGLEKKAVGELPPKMGSLYSLNCERSVKKHVDKIDLSNGLAWTSDDKTMFFVDSIPRKVYAFDFDAQAGEITNQRTAIDFSKGTPSDLGCPDGMTIDTEGKLWIASFFVGKVFRFDPETGSLLQEIKFPTSRTTSVTWGGVSLDDLYVTTSAYGFSEEQIRTTEALAGSVFRVTGLGCRGRPANSYQG
ncbi:regucalcin-like [Gigantopelta aegis]|uniref:regucalcin-like n=1 Tax=Gigantopelta aegis TaxID=1735272 RepID=UPI001B88A7C9|nr:regucalcin-like [Gigantopelta aegis]